MKILMAVKVVARYQQKMAGQSSRMRVRDIALPVNKPKGIDRGVLKDNGELKKGDGEDSVNPSRKDILPKDVFSPTPNNVGVRSLAESEKDLSKAINNQIPKDKGYPNVKNLSQYLIWSEGGSGEGPVGKKA